MDSAGTNGRKFPAYTTAQLQASVERGVTDHNDAATIEAIKVEIARREAGLSVRYVVPQIAR